MVNLKKIFKTLLLIISIPFIFFFFQSGLKENETGRNPASLKRRGNETIDSFMEAKKLLNTKVYNQDSMKKTLYCNCSYNKKKEIDLESCGLKIRKNKKRATRLEWEHAVPAHLFGQTFTEWVNGDKDCNTKKGKDYKGRKCAQKTNREFRLMEADLYNLFPAEGEVNGDRENFMMDEIAENQGDRPYGGCKVEIDKKQQKFEPLDEDKGMMARTYLYMEWAYPMHVKIGEEQKKRYINWDKKFPVTEFECKRGKLIQEIQKNINEILQERCKKAGHPYQ